MRFMCLHIYVFPLLQGAYFSLLKADFKKSDTKLTKEMDTSILCCAYCVLRNGERGIIFWVQTCNSLGESMVGWAENSAIKFRPLSHTKGELKKKKHLHCSLISEISPVKRIKTPPIVQNVSIQDHIFQQKLNWSIHDEFQPVSYTHLTLPTKLEV